MTTSNESGARTPNSPELHLVCGSGGSRAILAGAGAILALNVAGHKRFKSVGGISGGSIPTVLLASGRDAKELMHQALDIDFSSMLTRHGGIAKIILAYFMQRWYEKTRPPKGVLSSEKLGAFIESLSAEWPESYWTMAVHEKDQYVFTAKGVFKIKEDGSVETVSQVPGPIGIAVRGSCAVPGIIDAVPYNGVMLHDGALGPEGRCPVGISVRFYGARRNQVVAMDVGEDESSTSRRIHSIWRIICGGECVPGNQEPLTEDGGLIVITPTVTNFRSLQFTLTRDQKWVAVMSGFMGALPALTQAGVLSGDKLEKAEEIANRFKVIQFVCEGAEDGMLAQMTEELLAKHDLY